MQLATATVAHRRRVVQNVAGVIMTRDAAISAAATGMKVVAVMKRGNVVLMVAAIPLINTALIITAA